MNSGLGSATGGILFGDIILIPTHGKILIAEAFIGQRIHDKMIIHDKMFHTKKKTTTNNYSFSHNAHT